MRMEDATAADVMTGSVETVSQEMDIREAISLFQELGISGAPVVDDENHVVGVLSQSDIVRYYLSRDEQLVSDLDFYQRANLEGERLGSSFEVVDTNVARVEEVMSPVTITVDEETPVRDLARLMTTKQIHRVIVTREEIVTGIVSALDLLKIFFR